MAVGASFVLCCILLVAGLLSAEPQQQRPLLIQVENGQATKEIDLIYELKKAEIIPTVIDPFKPLLTVSLKWKNATAKYGNTIDVDKTQDAPKVKFIDALPGAWDKEALPQLTIVISDPDAPSRDNPEWSEVCHWIATSVPLSSTDGDDDDAETKTGGDAEGDVVGSKLEEVMPYKPPGPPPTTGKHRYVLVALAPLNGTTEALHLRQPDERRRWGFEHERQGLRKWAEEMGLGVVGANFIYEQNEEQ